MHTHADTYAQSVNVPSNQHTLIKYLNFIGWRKGVWNSGTRRAVGGEGRDDRGLSILRKNPNI